MGLSVKTRQQQELQGLDAPQLQVWFCESIAADIEIYRLDASRGWMCRAVTGDTGVGAHPGHHGGRGGRLHVLAQIPGHAGVGVLRIPCVYSAVATSGTHCNKETRDNGTVRPAAYFLFFLATEKSTRLSAMPLLYARSITAAPSPSVRARLSRLMNDLRQAATTNMSVYTPSALLTSPAYGCRFVFAC